MIFRESVWDAPHPDLNLEGQLSICFCCLEYFAVAEMILFAEVGNLEDHFSDFHVSDGFSSRTTRRWGR